MPIFSRRNTIIDPDTAASEGLRHRLVGNLRTQFQFFHDVKKLGMVEPFARRLTEQQEGHVCLIKRLKGWDDCRHRFAPDITNFRFMTLTTQSYKPNPAEQQDYANGQQRRDEQGRVLFVMVGTITGKAAIFDLEELYGGTYPEEYEPTRLLPEEVLGWLTSTNIIIAGIDIMDHLNRLRIIANNLVDMRSVYRRAMMPIGELQPVINLATIAEATRGAMIFASRGEDYRPMKLSKYVSSYGKAGRSNIKASWPQTRNSGTFYKWSKGSRNRLSQLQIFHLYLEATDSTASLATLAIELFARNLVNPWPTDTPAVWALRILEPYRSNGVPPPVPFPPPPPPPAPQPPPQPPAPPAVILVPAINENEESQEPAVTTRNTTKRSNAKSGSQEASVTMQCSRTEQSARNKKKQKANQLE